MSGKKAHAMYGIKPRHNEEKCIINQTSDLCGLYPYSLIMRENGIEITERELFARLRLFNLDCYFVKDGKQSNVLQPDSDAFCLSGIAPFCESNLNGLSNIYFYKINISCKQNAIEEILHHMNLSKKIIIFADVYYLKYHPLYKRYHSQTQIIVHQYDKGCFYISDHHLPTFPISCFGGWLPEEELMESLLIENNNEQSDKIGIISYTVNETKHLIPFNLNEEIGDTFNKYLSDNFHFGFNVKDRIANALDMVKQSDNEKCSEKLMLSAYKHLTGRAGVVLSRKIMKSLLDELGFSENKFDEIIEMWQGIAGGFFRLSLKYYAEKLDELYSKINEVIDVEYKEICKWRESLKF